MFECCWEFFFSTSPLDTKIPGKVPCKCYCVGLEEIGSRLTDVGILWVISLIVWRKSRTEHAVFCWLGCSPKRWKFRVQIYSLLDLGQETEPAPPCIGKRGPEWVSLGRCCCFHSYLKYWLSLGQREWEEGNSLEAGRMHAIGRLC